MDIALPDGTPVAPGASPPGVSTNKLLSASVATQLAATSVVCRHGVWVSNPYDSGVIVQIGDSTVTAAKGIQLLPGERLFVPCSDMSRLYAYSTGTPTVHLQPW